MDIPLRPHERLAGVDWPTLREIDVPSISNGDCLLLCAGFERRSIETLRRLSNNPLPRLSIVLVEYLPAYEENRAEEIRSLAKVRGIELNSIVYDRRSPAGISEKIRGLTASAGRLWVDVSGMSRLLIVQILVGLLRSGPRTVYVLYAEAETYSPLQAEYESNAQETGPNAQLSYLSSGVFEIAVAPELSSVAMLAEAIRLVAFPSFDPSQLANVIDELQPTYTDLIHGTPPLPQNRWRRQAIEQLHGPILKELRGKTEHQVSTFGYRETLQLLIDIYDKHNSFDRIVICPTGSKMQSIAVGLFRAAVTDIQIVYPTPQAFVAPDSYTIGVRGLHEIRIPETAFSQRTD